MQSCNRYTLLNTISCLKFSLHTISTVNTFLSGNESNAFFPSQTHLRTFVCEFNAVNLFLDVHGAVCENCLITSNWLKQEPLVDLYRL